MAGIGRFLINRGEPSTLPSVARNYSGTLYAVRFMVDKPILIHGVGFYGPNLGFGGRNVLPGSHWKPTVPIFIRLEFKQSIYHDPNVHDEDLKRFTSMRMYEAQVPIGGTMGKVFLIELPDPVKIPAGLLVEAKFELLGANKDDNILFFRLPDDHPSYQKIPHPESGVEWTFLMSSKQLGCFLFSLQEDREDLSQQAIVVEAQAEPRVVSEIIATASEPAGILPGGGGDIGENENAVDNDDGTADLADRQHEHEDEHIYEEILERLEERASRPFLKKLTTGDYCTIA